MIPWNDVDADAYLGWMYPKNSMLQPLFDQYMKQLHEHGILSKIFHTKEKSCPTDPTIQISFDFVKILFLILCIGILMALLTLCAEFFVSYGK